MKLDYKKIRKTLIAAVGAVLLVVSQNFPSNQWVEAVVAAATVFGVYQVKND